MYLLILGLLILVLGLAACGRTSVPGDQEFTVPHDTGLGFANCLVCHTGGETAINLDLAFHQINPTNKDCLIPGCHAEGVAVKGDGKYLTTHELTGFFEDCKLCHYIDPENPLGMLDDATHQVGNEACVMPICHPAEGSAPTITPPPTQTTTTPPVSTTEPPATTTTTPPTQTTTTPPATTTTTTPPTQTTTTPPATTTEPPTTTTTEPPVISVEWHPGLTDTSLCFICHVGVEGQVVNPWPADHAEEGRANDSCLNDDCHVFEQQ